MPHHPTTKIAGTVTHVFAHRFVVEAAAGPVLADLTPHGRDQVTLRIGDDVTVEGEQKPSELKVGKIVHGGKTITIEHGAKHGGEHGAHADPTVVLRAARDAGVVPIGEPRRKPKHFEVLGKRDGKLTELHIGLDGHIRKEKPAAKDDPKWATHL